MLPKYFREFVKVPKVLMVLVVLGVTGCSSTGSQTGVDAVENYNSNPLTVAIPEGVSPEDVEKAMKQTLIGRKWSVVSSSTTEVVGHLDHRAFDATATLKVDGSTITILNAATHTSPHTGLQSPGVPMNWLLNLQKDLGTNLTSVY